MDWLLDPVRISNGSRDPQTLLGQPTSVLLGVTEHAASVLAEVEIATVFDLATSELFSHARNISLLEEDGRGSFSSIGRVPRDALRDGPPLSLDELVAAPISRLASSVPAVKLDELAEVLDLHSIRDMAAWPPYRAACDLLNRVYNPAPSLDMGQVDPETPPDLLPATGQYPTERVQYEVLLFDSFIEDAGPQARPLVKAGQLDVSKIGSSPEGYTVPAIGGVLTYTQSWYTKGLSLGHLIHGVALGPGEATKIAVIDWARQVRTAAVESIEELELLVEELGRSRSIGEITSAVARETQKGRSAAQSEASAMQFGESRSGANLRDFDPFSSPTAFTGLSVISPGVSVSGSSLGIAGNASDSTSWSTTSGQRDIGASLAQDIVDRTHQEAHSARNRRASIVREVSQQESETVSTRTLTNYNHMHALTIEYYEVVQLYRTVVELSKADRCVFVPMKPLDFRDMKVIDRYRAALMDASLSPVMREALSLPASTTPVRAPAVLSAELQAGDLTADAVSSLADDKWLARDISAAFAATGGQIRVMADGRLALPSDAVLSGVELFTGPRPSDSNSSGGTASDGTSSGGFFVGRQVIPVSANAPTKPGLRIQKGSRVHVTATGQVTFGSDVAPEDRFWAGPSDVRVNGYEIKNTGLKIQKGSRIHMTAAGSVNFHTYVGDAKSWDPDGTKPNAAGPGYIRPELYAASLICRIGSTWEQGGKDKTFTAPADDVLILQPNDLIGGLDPPSNNDGWWDVQLEVTAPPGTPPADPFNADGFIGPAAGPNYYAPDARKNSLVCQVGTTWHQGGTNTEFTAAEDGELTLQPNDLVGDLANNSGGWQVTFEVTAPAPDTGTPTPTTEPSLTVSKRAGGSVTVQHETAGWPVSNIQLRLEDIESVSLTTPGARAQDIGFLALTFTFHSKDFRIAVPVKLRTSGAATVFHADVPADLVSHLLDHRLYYSQVIWRSLDPATIGVLLSGYTWRLDGQSRRLVEIVDPTPVAIVANYLALRLSGDAADEYNAWIARAKLKVGSTREDQVPIPTGGVFAEAVLGRANSAEKLDITRFWDWQESPIPFGAPEIAAVDTGSRRDVDTTVPGQLGQPVLNIVNPPGLPDPQGMGAILAAIQNGNIFRDMSGLAGTIGLAQAGAAEAGQAAQQAAQQAGSNAAVAAQLGAKVAEIAGQIISAYLTKGGSLLGGGGGGGNDGLIQKPGGNSKSGSVLNYARDMDKRAVPRGGSAGTSSSRGSSNGGSSGTGGSQGEGAGAPSQSTEGSWEANAMQTTTDAGSGLPGTPLGMLLSLIEGGTLQEKAGEAVVDVAVKLIDSAIATATVTPDFNVDAPGLDTGAFSHVLLAGYEDPQKYVPGAKGAVLVYFLNIGAGGSVFFTSGFSGLLGISWEDCFLDAGEVKPADSSKADALSSVVCKRNIRFTWAEGATQGLAKAFVKARLSVPALRAQAKVSGEGKAPFPVQTRVSFGYIETGAIPDNIQEGFDVDLPTVTDPIAQSQAISVTKSTGGAGASRFTVARTPFE